MCESENMAVMPKIINGTAAQTLFQDSQGYVTVLLLEWCIYHFAISFVDPQSQGFKDVRIKETYGTLKLPIQQKM